mmetsp:Transcript_7988/g.25623  ORF Transcript_7988/g.25623 Transcript_7988/m.25623 type:complete len:178 (-) Transcript_7988:261-794(-)
MNGRLLSHSPRDAHPGQRLSSVPDFSDGAFAAAAVDAFAGEDAFAAAAAAGVGAAFGVALAPAAAAAAVAAPFATAGWELEALISAHVAAQCDAMKSGFLSHSPAFAHLTHLPASTPAATSAAACFAASDRPDAFLPARSPANRLLAASRAPPSGAPPALARRASSGLMALSLKPCQ